MPEDWLARWKLGRTGWHEVNGNAGLKKFWPALPARSRVLVPLCGKSPDLAWLASRNLDVTGVELSPIAAESFFVENELSFSVSARNSFQIYRSVDRNLEIFCGDYFTFAGGPFDALYDRGSLVALPANVRGNYVRHTDSLLRSTASKLVITVEYDQAVVDGPPFSVTAGEVQKHWPALRCLSVRDDLENCPPKFREAGLQKFVEIVWAELP